MKGIRPVYVSLIIFVLIAFGALVQPPMALPMQPEGTTAPGGGVSQSENCLLGREQNEPCLPGGLGSPAGSGSTPTPPVPPPVTPPVVPPAIPPVTLPITPPAGPPPHPHFPQLIAGTAKATLHIHDGDQDVTYDSDVVALIFFQRAVQDMPGTTQYVLLPYFGNVVSGGDGIMRTTWTAKGRRFDCTIDGKATVNFTADSDGLGHGRIHGMSEPVDITRPAFGYLNLVGPDGGDYHHIMVKMTDPEARITKTCPGPMITQEPLEAAFLLHVVWEKNRFDHQNGRGLVFLKGQLSFDQDDPLSALNLLPPGPAREIAREGYKGQGFGALSGTGTSHLYTWEWDLYGVMPDVSQPPAP